MSDRSIDGTSAAPRSALAVPMLSVLEWTAVGLAVLSMVMLFAIEARGTHLTSRLAADDIRMFLPHLALISLVVAGLRRIAALLMVPIVIAAALFGLAACLDSLTSSRSPLQGLGFVALLQIALLWVCILSARESRGVTLDPPRLALGALTGAAGWLVLSASLAHLDAPRHAAEAAARRTAARAAAERATHEQFLQLAGCIQRGPVAPDSQPLFPASLAELAPRDCPAAATPAPEGFAFDYTPGAPDSSGGRHTFKLAAHEQPKTDSSRTWTTDETFVVNGWYGRDDRRLSSTAWPLGVLAEAGRCVEAARDSATGGYPGTIAELVRAHPCGARVTADSSAFLGSASDGVYLVHYAPPSGGAGPAPGGYTLSMEPRRDSSGRNVGGGFASFLVDSAGLIHMTRRPRAATLADPVLPDCPANFASVGADHAYCRPYLPRQRWGQSSQLPLIGWSMSGSGTVASGDTLYVIPHYMPAAPADSLVEARIAWSAGGTDSVIRRTRDGIGEAFDRSVIFRLKHVYPDTGNHVIRFRVRTAVGEEYEFRDTVRVLMRWRRPTR